MDRRRKSLWERAVTYRVRLEMRQNHQGSLHYKDEEVNPIKFPSYLQLHSISLLMVSGLKIYRFHNIQNRLD